jgi:uncharacterized repeat protein (TIGR01451 family)
MNGSLIRGTTCMILIIAALLTGLVQPARAEETPAFEREFVYVLEDSSSGNRIHGYLVDGASGILTPLGEPVVTGYVGDDNSNTGVQRLAFHAVTRRLFVINGGDRVLSTYKVDTKTGVLTPEHTVALGVGGWLCVDIHPSGSSVVVGGGAPEGDSYLGQVHSFVVDDNDLMPASGSPFSAGAAIPYSCRFSQDGMYVYAGGYGPTEIAGFAVNPENGVLTTLSGSPFDSGVTYPVGYATDNEGRLFVASSLNGEMPVKAYLTSAGIPTPVAEDSNQLTFSFDSVFNGISHPSGYYMAASYIRGDLGVFSVEGNSSATTLESVTGSPFNVGGPLLALNHSGTMLFSASLVGGIYSSIIDTQTGEVGSLSSFGTGEDDPVMYLSGIAYAAAPPAPPTTHGYVYALSADENGSQIHGYGVDRVTGRLTSLDGFPVPTGGNGNASGYPERMFFDPNYQRLYVLNNLSSSISAFDLDLASGKLTPLPESPWVIGGYSWDCLTVHPSGSPIILAKEVEVGTRGVIYSINVDDESLTTGSTAEVRGSGARQCVFSSTGDYLYVFGPDIGAYRVDSGDGSLIEVSGSPFLSGVVMPQGVTVDANDRLLMIGTPISMEDNDANFAFFLQDGRPISVNNSPFQLGFSPGLFADALVHPSGYYLSTSSALKHRHGVDAVGALGVFRVTGQGTSTDIEIITSGSDAADPFTFPFGIVGTKHLVLDHTGTMLFAANPVFGLLMSAEFDPATGRPQGLSMLPEGSLGGTSISIAGFTYAAPLPDATLSITSTSVFSTGLDVTYTLEVTNRSPIDGSGPIEVVDNLPDGLSFRSFSGNGWNCTPDQGRVQCIHQGPLPGNSTLPNVQITATVAHGLAELPTNNAQVTILDKAELIKHNNEASFTPERATQTIQFPTIPDQELGNSPFNVSANASSNLPVQFHSETTSVCTVDGVTLTLHTTGLCSISADQPGNWAYRPALQVQQHFNVVASAPEQEKLYFPLIHQQ